jgi:hypothetical protein
MNALKILTHHGFGEPAGPARWFAAPLGTVERQLLVLLPAVVAEPEP